MRNVDVLKNFVMGFDKGKTKNLRIDGDNLINYKTVIAKRERVGRDVKKIYVTKAYYSKTTTRILNQLKELTPKVLLEESEVI